jgi:hypothetical protein
MEKCEKCGSDDIKIEVPVVVQMDKKNYIKITKNVLREKRTIIQYAIWDKTTFVCQSCNYSK